MKELFTKAVFSQKLVHLVVIIFSLHVCVFISFFRCICTVYARKKIFEFYIIAVIFQRVSSAMSESILVQLDPALSRLWRTAKKQKHTACHRKLKSVVAFFLADRVYDSTKGKESLKYFTLQRRLPQLDRLVCFSIWFHRQRSILYTHDTDLQDF